MRPNYGVSNMSETSSSGPAPAPKAIQSPLTLVMKIKSDAAYQELKALLNQMQSAPPDAIRSGSLSTNSEMFISPDSYSSTTTPSSQSLRPTMARLKPILMNSSTPSAIFSTRSSNAWTALPRSYSGPRIS